MEINQKKELIFTWEELWQYCEIIYQSIIEKKTSYTQIVAIARGGFYLGDYLSRKLNIPLSVIVAESYTQQNQQNQLTIANLSYITPPQGKILLVDDLLDTGITMTKIEEILNKNWQIEIDTAVIWRKSHCQYQPDYYYSLTPHEYWIIQPFEVYS